MFQKNLILVVTLLSLPVFQCSSLAASGLIGSAAPYFRVQSGDDIELTLDMIKGKVAAIFYENKDIVDANKRLKDELNKLYFEQTDALKDVLVRLPIVRRHSGPSWGYGKEDSENTLRKRASPSTVTGKAR
jgi:hypothetical protein